MFIWIDYFSPMTHKICIIGNNNIKTNVKILHNDTKHG